MEYKALQAQINPHFLYNTLDTMSSIAEIQNCNTVSNLSQALSRIFRYSLDHGSSMSTVEREIIHLNSYIYVMNVRMCNQITYDFQIAPQTLQLVVPKLTIQPLVENAVKHGLKNAHSEKKIVIRTELIQNTLSIYVTDTGVGFDAQQMNQQMESAKNGHSMKSDSIGLHNINSRIKILYGTEYGIRISSEIGTGTSVAVTLPAVKGEKGNEGTAI
jgi:sensor histidine kinase YesM